MKVYSARTDGVYVPRLASRVVWSLIKINFFLIFVFRSALGRGLGLLIGLMKESLKKGKTHEHISSLLLKKRRIAHRKCLKEVRD
jgi:hypothetical protein